jgi:protein TonB
MIRPVSIEQVAGLAIVLALHAAALWGLWQHRLIPSPQEAMTLFVNFIAPAVPERVPPPPPKQKTVDKPKLRQIVAAAPVVSPTDYVVPPPPPQPVPRIEAPVTLPPTPLAPAGPIALGSELAVACPERTPPAYPTFSRRMGEEGTVILRVELDEAGVVAHARVQTSSGFARLDEAALDAVRTWRCTPARRDGQPVRAVALQPFKFILQGS